MAKPDRWQDEPFGEDDTGWNLETSGRVGIITFGNAIQVWSTYQDRKCTVAEAARVLNCAPEKVHEAVDMHPWMDAIGPNDDFEKMIIEHEGE